MKNETYYMTSRTNEHYERKGETYVYKPTVKQKRQTDVNSFRIIVLKTIAFNQGIEDENAGKMGRKRQKQIIKTEIKNTGDSIQLR